MTLNELMEYRNLVKEVEEQEEKLRRLRECPTQPIVAGVIKYSIKKFPYTQTSGILPMEDKKAVKAKMKCIIIKEQRIKEATELMVRIEEYIKAIEDSELRRIFEWRFIDGHKLGAIAEHLNMDRSTVGKKIMKYLKHSPNSPK